MEPFYWKLLLSFIAGGTFITLATVAAERFGSKIGGIVAGVPSTVLVSLAFIAWTQGTQKAFEVITVIPLAISVNCLYVATYAALATHVGWLPSIAAGLILWLVAQNVVVALKPDHLLVNIVAGCVIVAVSYYFLEQVLKISSRGKVAHRYTPMQIAGRAVFSGSMISFAVVMSRVAGSTWGGIFSSFPAVMTATLVITSLSVNVEFSRSVIKPLMLSGVVNPAIYALVFRYAILDWSILASTAIAFSVSMVSVVLTYLFIRFYAR
jgi:hypothetical protein